MRVLFTFVGGTGHSEPMVPVAKSLLDVGHTVGFAGDQRYLSRLSQQGFDVITADSAAWVPERRQALVEPDQAHEDAALQNHYVGEVPRRRIETYQRLFADWEPDLLVRDEADFGAAIVAEQLAIPRVEVLIAAAGATLRPEVIGHAWNRLRAAHDLPADHDFGRLYEDLVLSPFPPRFRDPEYPLPRTAQSFRRDLPDEHKSELPPWWPLDPDLLIIYVTLGTVFPLESGDLFERILSGLGQLQADVVTTVGPDLDPAALGPQPDHVHVEQWLPQAQVMPHVDLVVSHGGSGTISDALQHGVPQLVVPLGADQMHNARRVEALGIGHSLHPITTTSEQFRDAAASLITDRCARAAAARFRAEIAALPSPAQLLGSLETLGLSRGLRS